MYNKCETRDFFLQGILKSRDMSPTYWDDYDVTAEDSYDPYLDEDYLISQRDPRQMRPEPCHIQPDSRPIHPDSRPIHVQPRPSPARQIDVSPIKSSGRGKFDMPRLKLSLDDVDEEVPRMQQTGDTTGELFID